MAIGRNQHEVGVHYKTTADTRGAREIATAQQRALAQMRTQQAAFAQQNQRQWTQIENATKRSAFKTGSGATASLRNGIKSGTKQVHQAGNNLVSVMEKHAVRMGGVFQQLGFQAQLAGTTLTRAFTLPAAAAAGLGTAVGIKLAARLESARAALGALLPVGYNVEALIVRLRKKAIASPVFNTPELVDFTRKLVSAGVEVRKSERIIDSLGKVFQTFGVSGEGVSLALRGVTQAFSKGKLQAEELTGQIGEQIPALKLLARAAGVSQAQFLKLVRQGKITSDVFADLLVKIGQFPEINKGATASLFTMQGAWDRLKESIFDALAMTWLKYSPQIQKSLKELERAIPGLLAAFGPLVPKMVDGFTLIVKAITNTVRWYNNLDEGTKRLIKTLALVAVTSGPLILFFGKLATLAGALVAAFRALLTPLGKVALGFAALASIGIVKWLTDVKEGTSTLGGILDRLGAGWDSAGQKTVGFAGHLRTVNTDFDDGNKKAGELSGSLRSLDKDFSDTGSQATGLSGTFRSLGRDFTTLGETSKKPTDGIKELGRKARELWEAINGNLLPALGDLGKKLLDEVVPSLKDTAGAINVDLLPAMTNFTNKLADWIKENSDTIAEGVGGWASDLIDGVREGIEKGDWKQVGKALGNALGEAIKGIGDLTDKFKGLAKNVDWVEVGKEFGKNAVGFLVGFLSGLGEDIFTTDFWKKHWLDVIIAVLSVTGVGKIGALVGKIGAKIGGKVFKEIGKAFKKFDWGKLFQPFRNAFNRILPPNTQAMFRVFFDNIANLVKNGAGRIASFASGVREKFSAIFDDIGIRALYFVDWIKGIFRKIGDGAFRALDRALLQPVSKLGLRFRNAVITTFARFAFLEVLVEAGKDLVQGFINGIVEWAKDVWKSFKDHVIDPLVDGVKGFLGINSPSTFFYDIGKNIVQGLKDGISSAVSGFGSLFSGAWESVRTTTVEKWEQVRSSVVGAVNRIKEGAGTAANTVKDKISTSWDAVKTVTSEKWNLVKDAVGGALNKIREKTGIDSTWIKDTLSNAWDKVTSGVRTAWDTVWNVIRSRWDAVRNTVSTVWNRYIWPIFKSMMKVITRDVPNAFSAGVATIGKFFSSLGNVLKAPVNWVISYVINRGIISPLNFIKDKLGIGGKNIPWVNVIGGSPPRPPAQRSGLTAGRAQGGRLRGGVPGKDSIPVMAMQDEYVIKTKSARKIGFDRLEYMNRTGEVPGYASGGRVHGKRRKVSDKPSASKRSGGPLDAIMDAILDPIGWLTKKAGVDRVLDQFRSIKGSEWGKIVSGLPKKALDMALQKITSWLGSLGGDGGGYFLGRDNSSSISTILTIARRFYRGARVSSGYRPGDSGYHGRGLAADLIGGGARGMATIARGFMGMSGRLLELIHSGGGGFFVKNGKRVGASFYRSVIGGHYNHVHVAARKDALLARLGLGTGGGNLGAWVRQAMGITGVPNSWYEALVALAKHESGGNPRAQNNWDSNARAGHPSKGLFQTIDSTFNRWSLPGMKNIWNPVHNAVAAIRYIRNRYGSIFQIPSYRPGNRFVGGYRNGIPFVPEDGLKYLHKGERVVTAAANRKFGKAIARQPSMVPIRSAEASGGIHIHFDGPVMGRRDLEDSITEILESLRRKGRMPGR